MYYDHNQSLNFQQSYNPPFIWENLILHYLSRKYLRYGKYPFIKNEQRVFKIYKLILFFKHIEEPQ